MSQQHLLIRLFFVRNPVPPTHAKCRKNEFWAFVKWVLALCEMSFWLLPSRFGQFLQKCWPFHQISQAKWEKCPIFWYFEWICVTFQDKLSKTNEKGRFFGFETWVLPSVKWVLPLVKWVLPSVKWVSAILGEMSFRQNAQKKPALQEVRVYLVFYVRVVHV